MLSEDFFQNILSVRLSGSNSLDPDQVRHFVGPDLGPNCVCKDYQQTTLVGRELSKQNWCVDKIQRGPWSLGCSPENDSL